jgi:GT2 family glycosyltransferase
VRSSSPVGVVVATRNRSARLLATLEQLRELPERPRVVVVDNGSSDGTPDAVRARHPEVELVPLQRNLGAAARTIGARRLDAPFVAFSDDDSWWAPGALARAAGLFEAHPKLGLLASRILVGPEQRLDPTCEAMARSPLPRDDSLPGPAVCGFVACGAVVRRQAFLAAGGFHPRLCLGAEETLLALDLATAGWQLAYVDEVVAHHHPDPGPRDGRSTMAQRNLLWCAWLRLPFRLAARETHAALARARKDPSARAALGAALHGVPWVARERRCVAPDVADAYTRTRGPAWPRATRERPRTTTRSAAGSRSTAAHPPP